MAASTRESDDTDGAGGNSQWDAYSDYQLVSRNVTEAIDSATRAFSMIDQSALTGRKLKGRETELRADILDAAMRLRVELEAERERGESYASDILDRWEGEEGFLRRFRSDPGLVYEQADWFEQFVSDIRRAGWELGYLKAGKENDEQNGGSSQDGQIHAMIEGGVI